MNRAFAFPLILLLAQVACGGSSPPKEKKPEPTVVSKTDEEREQERKLARLRKAQESACEKMCPELTGCAVEDARAEMSEEELAKLDLESTAPRHTAECIRQCSAGELSPRQVRVIQDCLTRGGTCDDLRTCLAAAQKRAQSAD